jgi:hypothetical protein
MPSKKDRLCFVLMPFQDDLKEVYSKAIKPACEKVGFTALRADELTGPFNIHRDIIQFIFTSDAIVADLTAWNPNVFYEMGVAHAIDNKTIMIIQKGHKLPFDIGNYRCIFYEQSERGLELLAHDLEKYFRTMETWRQRPTNPVQEHKPHEAFIPKSEAEKLERELQRLQKELQARERFLQATVPKSELEALQRELTKQTEIAAKLEQELQRLRSRTPAAPSKKVAVKPAPIQLRSQPRESLSEKEVQAMLKERGFFDRDRNKKGKGLLHQFEKIDQQGEKLVIDHATGLTWQQSGSPDTRTYAEAEKYIRELNDERFAGYSDWRLPTLEEAMSLMEPKKHGEMYIDPIFDNTQRYIWTADKFSAGAAWYVIFLDGGCYHSSLGSYFVRAVR